MNTVSFIFLVFLPSSGDRTLRQLVSSHFPLAEREYK